MPYCTSTRVIQLRLLEKYGLRCVDFAELTQSRYYVGISYSEFHQNGNINVESWDILLIIQQNTLVRGHTHIYIHTHRHTFYIILYPTRFDCDRAIVR